MDELISALTNPGDAHFWIFVALALLLAILWRAGAFGAAGKALDEAGAKVQAQLDEAVRLRQEAEGVLAQIKVKREETERAAAEMMANAQADAERLRAEAAVKLEEDIRRRGLMAERKIAAAEAQAAADVKAAAADLAAQIAESVLAARAAAAGGDPLIDAGIANLSRRFS
jgi:F-type H+-transporting ATPase subunit b